MIKFDYNPITVYTALVEKREFYVLKIFTKGNIFTTLNIHQER